MIVAEVERLQTVLQTPEWQKVQFMNTVIAEQQTFDFDAEKITNVYLKHTSKIWK